LKPNGTHQLLVYADDASILGGNTNILKKITEPLVEVSRETGLEVNTEKATYIVMSCYQNVGQNHNLLAANKSFVNVAKFKYLGITLTSQNSIHDEIKNRLNPGSACYRSVKNLLSCRLLSKT
jgi:hypothetical protein